MSLSPGSIPAVGRFRDMEAEPRVTRRDVGLGLPVVARVADDQLFAQIEPQRLSGENPGRGAVLAPWAAAGGPVLAEVAAHRVRGHVEHSAVCERAEQLHIFPVRPDEGHGRARRFAGRELPVGNGCGVPHLLGNQAARACLRLDCCEQRLRLLALSRRKRVVRPFARQERPDAADPDPVEGASVRLLAVAVEVIAAPAGPLRQLDLEQAIDDRNRIEHASILRRPQPEPDKRERIRADEFVRRDRSASHLVVAHLDQSMNVGATHCRRFGSNPYVVAADADLPRERRILDVDPVLDLLVPCVSRVAQQSRRDLDVAGFRDLGRC